MTADQPTVDESRWKDLLRVLPKYGGTTPKELRLLYDLASRVRRNCIVEIGCFLGRSTIVLASATKAAHGVPVFAIDPHETALGAMGAPFGPDDRAAFFRNLLNADVADVVSLVNLRSLDAARGWNRNISLLFVDGDHRYEAVRDDFNAWSPHVAPSGAILFHDAFNPDLGVGRVVEQAVASGGYERVFDVGKICGLRKLPVRGNTRVVKKADSGSST
jgi:predicted O-methyltransferase YrrM